MRKIVLVLVFISLALEICSQGLKVVKMELSQTDFDVRKSDYIRIDSTGTRCGLVKVRISMPNIDFGKNAVGEVENKMNEYWVYLPLGTKWMAVEREHYLPYKIQFRDYGIEEISSNNLSYVLTLKESKFDEEKHALVVNVAPKNATLKVDGIEITKSESGSYRLYLEKGEHICRTEILGYLPKVEVVYTGKGKVSCEMSMESLMADINISCAVGDADILVNGVVKGKGSWIGFLPAGNYTIQARKSGYEQHSQDIVIEEKGKYDFLLPELVRKKGTIRIVSNVSDFTKVELDGDEIEVQSNQIKDVNSGKHAVTIYKYGYLPVKQNVVVSGEGTDTLYVDMIVKDGFEEVVRGVLSAQYHMATECKRNTDYKQAEYWLIKAIENYPDGEHNSFSKLDFLKELASLYRTKENRWSGVKNFYHFSKAVDAYKEMLRLLTLDKTKDLDYEIKDVYWNLGNLYKDEKKYEEAIEWYQKCHDLAESGIDYYWHCLDMGDCYKELGNFPKAKYWYQFALDNSNDSSVKEKALLIIETLNK